MDTDHVYIARYGQFRFRCKKKRAAVDCKPYFTGKAGAKRFAFCPVCGVSLKNDFEDDVNMAVDLGD